ncbi:MAG: Hpt domain-containing protein, partial [Desulfobacterales bacterium]|nr:Hpt domain-containing protein [Desulfobacterales bacterium]
GINEFVAKPVDMEHLFHVIEAFAPDQPRANGSPPMADAPLDRDKALAALGGNGDLLERILDIFAQETPEQLAALSRAAEARNFDEIRRHAHTLKGSAARIFADPGRESARRVETAAQARDMDGVTQALPAMEAAFQTLMDALQPQPKKE